MRTQYIFGIIVLFGGMNVGLKAQQFPALQHFRTYSFLYNPALSGRAAHTEVFLGHRQQWLGMPDAPSSSILALSWRGKSQPIGYGALLQQTQFGLLNRLQGRMQAAAHFGDERSTLFSIGAYGGFSDWRFAFTKYDNENNDPLLGTLELGTAFEAGMGFAFRQVLGAVVLDLDASAINIGGGNYRYGNDGIFRRERAYWGRAALEIDAGGFMLTPFFIYTMKKDGGPAGGITVSPDNIPGAVTLSYAPATKEFAGILRLGETNKMAFTVAAMYQAPLGLSLEGGMWIPLKKTKIDTKPKPEPKPEPPVEPVKPKPDMAVPKKTTLLFEEKGPINSNFEGSAASYLSFQFHDPDYLNESFQLNTMSEVDTIVKYIRYKVGQVKLPPGSSVKALEITAYTQKSEERLRAVGEGTYQGEFDPKLSFVYSPWDGPTKQLYLNRGDNIDGFQYLLLKTYALGLVTGGVVGVSQNQVRYAVKAASSGMGSNYFEIKIWYIR